MRLSSLDKQPFKYTIPPFGVREFKAQREIDVKYLLLNQWRIYRVINTKKCFQPLTRDRKFKRFSRNTQNGSLGIFHGASSFKWKF